jgi:hypothetical protein
MKITEVDVSFWIRRRATADRRVIVFEDVVAGESSHQIVRLNLLSGVFLAFIGTAKSQHEENAYQDHESNARMSMIQEGVSMVRSGKSGCDEAMMIRADSA